MLSVLDRDTKHTRSKPDHPNQTPAVIDDNRFSLGLHKPPWRALVCVGYQCGVAMGVHHWGGSQGGLGPWWGRVRLSSSGPVAGYSTCLETFRLSESSRGLDQ